MYNSNSIHCPKCRSDQFTAQKRGFSGGKAATGIILTGGIGALAGLHGSDKIDLHCLSCGHKWDPVKQSQADKIKRVRREDANTERWKKRFYKAYETGDREQAEAIVSKHLSKLLRRQGLDAAYKSLKRLDRTTGIIQAIFLVLFVGIMLWIIS